MATSNLDIISSALVLIGDKPLSDLTSADLATTVANTIYKSTYEAALTSHRWRFAIGKASLNRLVEEPLNEWSYAFQLPSDLLLAIGVRPRTNYEIYEDKLYSHQTEVILDYLYKPDESKLPAYFVKAMEYELATQFAVSITDNKSYYELYQNKAENQWRRARYADSQQRPNRAVESNPFISVRS